MTHPGFESAQNEYLELKRWLFEAALPLWSSVGRDCVSGGFFRKSTEAGLPLKRQEERGLFAVKSIAFRRLRKWAGLAMLKG